MLGSINYPALVLCLLQHLFFLLTVPWNFPRECVSGKVWFCWFIIAKAVSCVPEQLLKAGKFCELNVLLIIHASFICSFNRHLFSTTLSRPWVRHLCMLPFILTATPQGGYYLLFWISGNKGSESLNKACALSGSSARTWTLLCINENSRGTQYHPGSGICI